MNILCCSFLWIEAGLQQSTSDNPQLSRLECLCTQYKLTSEDIDKEVSDDNILKIYQQLEKWEEVAFHLHLTSADIEAIKGDAIHDMNLKRLYTLQRWKRKVTGTEPGATYRVLIEALLNCDSRSADALSKLISKPIVSHDCSLD